VANAKLEGVTLGYGGQLAGFDLTASLDFLDPKDADTGKRLQRRANKFANLSISGASRRSPWASSGAAPATATTGPTRSARWAAMAYSTPMPSTP
jgi:outer membrane cobalamin receptor